MHEINWDNDPEWVVEKGGLAELLKMQKEGKVRFVGFTGHKAPHIHLKMLPVHKWDTVQMPVNVCDHFYRSFAASDLPAAKKQGTAVIGMKSLRRRQGEAAWSDKVCTAEEAHPVRPEPADRVGRDRHRLDGRAEAEHRHRPRFKPMEGEELERCWRR